MSDTTRRVRDAARDARSTDDLVREPKLPALVGPVGELLDPPLASPLDRETLDEEASTQMGVMYESIRRDAN